MTRRFWALLAACITSAFCALSLGGRLYYFLAVLFALLIVYSLISCLWARRSISCRLYFPSHKVHRGEALEVQFMMQHRCLLPLSCIRCIYRYQDETHDFEFACAPLTEYEISHTLETAHVGAFAVTLEHVIIQDLFCLFNVKKRILNQQATYLVLPNPYPIDKPEVLPGDDGSAALGRTQEDYNAPEDTRAYLPGDAMKRIHWKLSSRRRELVVRRFEMPAPPDTLLLMDPSVPQAEKPQDIPFLRDALCETAVAVAKLQMEDGSPIRMPLHGQSATEFVSDQAEGLNQLKEMLAARSFSETEDFAHILRLELRRMRRTGAVVILTTRLNAGIVQGITSIRRMGPSARVYLCTRTPEDPELIPYISRLQHHLVEVCYVTPA